MEEKNYVLYKKDEIHEKAKKKLTELAGSLDAVDKVAERFNDKELAKKSKDVRELATQYGKLYDEGVATIKGGDAAAKLMAEKGVAVQNEAEAYMTAKKPEYMEGKATLQIANLINAGTPKMRLHVRMYMLYKQPNEVELAEEAAGQLFKQYDMLEKMHPDNAEQKQISDARDATTKYIEAFKKWVAIEKENAKSPQLAKLVTTQNEQGRIAIKAIEDYLTEKEARVDKDAEAVFIVSDIAQPRPPPASSRGFTCRAKIRRIGRN